MGRTPTTGGQPSLLKPVLRLTDRLRTSARLAVLTAVLLVPGVVATWSFAAVIGGQVGFSNSERAGVQVLAPTLTELSTATSSAATPSGTQALRAVAARHPDLDLAKAVAVVDAATNDPVARTSALTDLVTAIGNNSNLILDPDLDSFYVMDAQVVQLPKAVLAAVKAAVPVQGTSSDRVAAQALRAGELAGAAAAIRSDVATATQHTSLPHLAPRLASLEALAVAVETLGKQLSTTLDHPAAADPEAVLVTAAAAVGPATQTLDTLLTARADGLSRERDLTLAVTVACVALGLWLAAGVLWQTRRDVALTLKGVSAIAAGDLSVHPLPHGRDEFGDVGRSVAVARDQLLEQGHRLREARRAREQELHTNFLQQRAAERQARERAQNVIDETSTVVISELSIVVEQVEAVRTAAGTIDQRVSHANEVTGTVVSQATEADRVVTALGQSLAKVASMAQLIAGVADQTKLLALNATIEAARAGEAGRGFSVVADEVKTLAMTTAHSTGQITSIIGTLEHDAAAMSTAILAMSAGITGVNDATAGLFDVAQEQRTLVAQLDHSVGEAISRVQGMERLTETLERRHTDRVPARGPLVVRAQGRELPGHLSDLGTGGLACRLEGSASVGVGQVVQVNLTVHGTDLEIHANTARVTTGHGECVLGLEFLQPPAHVLSVINDYLDAALAGVDQNLDD